MTQSPRRRAPGALVGCRGDSGHPPRLICHCRGRGAGFTITELLVVLGLIAVLFALLTPTVTRAREMARRAKCLSNMRQITIAAAVYATDDPERIMIWKTAGSEDSLQPLYPNYLTDLNVAVCPSTDNVVTTAAHLKDNAALGARDASGGHSYE